MVFGWGRKAEPEDDDDDDEEVELVLFQGALNGVEPNMKENARLVSAGLIRAKEIVSDGLSRRAGLIRIEPKGERAPVSFHIDGLPYPGERISKQEAVAITGVLKLLAGLDVKDRKTTQQGGIKASYEETGYELQIITQAAEGGERLTVRATNNTVKLNTPQDLGMPDDFRLQIRELSSKPGIFLAVGPPGTGVTTLKYAILRGVDSFTHQIFTLWDTGKKLDNISLFKANEGDTLTNTLERCFRVDGDIILVPDFKGPDVVKEVMAFHERASMISELVTKDGSTAITQLIKWLGDPAVVATGLNGVLQQRLIRTLCPDCKQAYRPNPAFLKKVGLPETVKTLYRKPKQEEDEPELDSCDKCGDIGYYGQVAMFELIEMNEEMRELVKSNPDAATIKAKARELKMKNFQADGLRLVAEGKTSLEELQRFFKSTAG